MQAVQITVRSVGGEHLADIQCAFEDLKTTTGHMLKEEIHRVCGIHPALQRLINSVGSEVSDTDPLLRDSLGLLNFQDLQITLSASIVAPVQLTLVKAEMMRIAVGQSRVGVHRAMINHDNVSQAEWDAGASMTVAGWTHMLSFWAFTAERPGTIRIAVGQAHDPHRAMINHRSFMQSTWDSGQSMSTAGWTHKLDFWALAAPRPGAIRIAVGEANGPHRIMINHDSMQQTEWDAGASMSIAGWAHKMEFWAYPSKLEAGTQLEDDLHSK